MNKDASLQVLYKPEFIPAKEIEDDALHLIRQYSPNYLTDLNANRYAIRMAKKLAVRSFTYPQDKFRDSDLIKFCLTRWSKGKYGYHHKG